MREGVATADELLRQRASAMRKQFVASGTNVSEWARERGFGLRLVHQILRGERSCRRGESHRIAVALGIKVEQPVPGTVAAEQKEGAAVRAKTPSSSSTLNIPLAAGGPAETRR